MTKPKIPINTLSKLLAQKRALQDLSAHSNRRFNPNFTNFNSSSLLVYPINIITKPQAPKSPCSAKRYA